MKFISFASSSKGNATFISYKKTNVLIDCGISKKRIADNLAKYGKKISDIDCILLTHEHDDHILGLPSIIKDENVKVLSQRETLEKIFEKCSTKGFKPHVENFRVIQPINALNKDVSIDVKDIKIFPIRGFHDVPSVFYKLVLGDITIAVMTDMGKYDDYIINSISDVDYLMIECNYDADMLLNNNYPAWLKSRILSEKGHLSNVNCSEIIMRLPSEKIKKIYLSHISADANSEEYAINFVKKYINENCNDKQLSLKVNVCKRLEETIILDD